LRQVTLICINKEVENRNDLLSGNPERSLYCCRLTENTGACIRGDRFGHERIFGTIKNGGQRMNEDHREESQSVKPAELFQNFTGYSAPIV
jgi:hypothetical protein